MAALPIVPCLPRPDATSGLSGQLSYVAELSAALHSGARPSDELLCSAWLEAIGENRYVESAHPYAAGKGIRGDVEIPGASALRLTFHPRCATAPGATLTIWLADGSRRTYTGGPSDLLAEGGDEEDGDDEDGEGDGSSSARGRTAAGAKPKRGNWPTDALVVAGSRVKYEFAVPADHNPAATDAAGLRSASGGAAAGQTAAWGFGLTVTAAGGGLSRPMKLAALGRSMHEVEVATATVLSSWSPKADAELVDLARSLCDAFNARRSKSSEPGHTSARYNLFSLPLELLALPSAAKALQYPALVELPVPQLRMRFSLLRAFNAVLHKCLPCLNLSALHPSAVGFRVRNSTHCVFAEVKQQVLDAALHATRPIGSLPKIPTVKLSNFKATDSEARGDTSPEASVCMFAQAYYQLRTAPSSALRTVIDSAQNKVFDASFEGESGIDAGGVYREALQRILDDLFSERFSLLVKCPNAEKQYEVNTNAYLPNATLRSPLALSMFEFVGRLMGLSLRTKACLPFAFPSIVWRAMVGEGSKAEDLHAMDGLTAKFVAALRNCDSGVTAGAASGSPSAAPAIRSEAAFAAAFPDLRFTAFNCVGEEVELAPGGRDTPVTLANRHRYCDALEHFRVHEFDIQLAAIRRGLATMVPIRALSLFTWMEAEVLVCGSADVDVLLLKSKTRYDGYTASSAPVKRFWRVLARFTPAERCAYLRFCWGRSRLPPEGAHWTSTHCVSRLSGGDRALPMAHTCFL
jgi:hypothetical protein